MYMNLALLNQRLRDRWTTVAYSNALGAGTWWYSKWMLGFRGILSRRELSFELQRLQGLVRRAEWGALTEDDGLEVILHAAFVPPTSDNYPLASQLRVDRYAY